jgi:trans-aconitate 2-methyltransferase
MTDASTSREWNATAYDALNAPMNERGNDAAARLDLSGGETVLDAGCGTGEVTASVLARLPQGRLIALDGSTAMLAAARERFGEDPRVTYVHANLEQPLSLEWDVDAIVSTSTLHWVRDHDALWGHLAGVLRPGGQLVVDCGGDGNIARVLEILSELGHPDHPWTYASAEDTERRLAAAGFGERNVRLVPRVSQFASDEKLEAFLTNVVLRAHVAALGDEAGAALVRDVAARLPERELHWARLEVVARRGPLRTRRASRAAARRC